MKRDMEIIRAILLAVEAMDTSSGSVPHFELDGIDPTITDHHAQLLKEAGYISAEFVFGRPPRAIVTDLTWEGHEFLDAIRNDSVWQRLKKKIASEGGSIPVSVMKQLAVQYAKDLFGLST